MSALRLTSLPLITAAIETHGASRVLLAAAVALLRPKARPPDTMALNAHLRRDIGLMPEATDMPRGPRPMI